MPGAAMMVGSGNTIEHNCLTGNGQYAFNAYQNPGDPQVSTVTGGPQNIVLSDNEISYNDTCNWEAFSTFPIKTPAGCAGAGQFDGCGCSGGGKFWQDQNVTVQDNYVHDNYSTGIWADTDNNGFSIEGNYFSANYAEALIYEISYNALIKGNTFVRQRLGHGCGGQRVPGQRRLYLRVGRRQPGTEQFRLQHAGHRGQHLHRQLGWRRPVGEREPLLQ